jgi:class I lanthipeptide synthase
MKQDRWCATAHGELSAKARASIEEIASGLSRVLEEPEKIGPDLASGLAGIALFFHYHWESLNEPTSKELADHAAHLTAVRCQETSLGPGLYEGLAGIGWAIGYLGLSDSVDLDELDSALRQYLSNRPWRESFDLISGIVGLGTYGLERFKTTGDTRLVQLAIHRLYETCLKGPDGVVTWPDIPTAEKRKRFPKGRFDMGVAHGTPGVVAFLSSAHSVLPEDPCLVEMLDGAVAWLLKYRQPGGPRTSCFWYQVPPTPEEVSRSAWCYGDPGIAMTLVRAADVVPNRLQNQGVEVARVAALRQFDDAGVVDAGLCHGSSGLALIFHRLFQRTGEDTLRDASNRWIEETLRLRVPGEGLAGYREWWPDGDGTGSWRTSVGFLTGAAGVGLSLLASVTDVEPRWDRVLCLS